MINDKQIESAFRKIISKNNSYDELQVQITIDMTKWDTSKMEGYVAGKPVKTGYSTKISTLKPNKKFPRAQIHIDPSDKDVRKAILDMYAAHDKLVSN